jgi:hypothetical protein
LAALIDVRHSKRSVQYNGAAFNHRTDHWYSAKIPPAVNQIEAHPYLQQKELLEWHKSQVDFLRLGIYIGTNLEKLTEYRGRGI